MTAPVRASNALKQRSIEHYFVQEDLCLSFDVGVFLERSSLSLVLLDGREARRK